MTPELSLHLDEPARRYDAGEEVRGVLRTRGAGGRTVTVALDWITEGRGDPEQHEVAAETLGRGEPEGEDTVYTFSLRLPDEPRGYEGALFRLGYELRAVVSGSGGEATHETTLPVVTVSRPPPVALDAVRRGSDGFDRGCLGCSMLLVAMPIAWVLGGEDFASLGGGLLCFVASIGGLGILLSAGTVLAEQRIGRVRIDLKPPEGPGGYRDGTNAGLRCRVRFRARVPDSPTVRSTLVVRETTRTHEASTSRVLHHVVFESETELEAARAGDYQGRLALPPPGSAPLAFSGSHTSVVWEVRVHIDIPDWPDWSQVIRLPTRPGPA